MRQRKTDDTEILKLYHEGKSQTEIARHFNVSPVAIHKRLKRILPTPDEIFDKHGLTGLERRFVIEKVSGKSNTEAAFAVCETSSRSSAKVRGSVLMKKPEVEGAIHELMQVYGLTRAYRVKRLKSHVDAPDPYISLKALDMTFKLDGYDQEKHEDNGISWMKIITGIPIGEK